ncbi:hypothetical protein ILUMI_05146 [Ignelater luminosus]|uniref:Cytochrome P450 n=1 Tax=Ignelater luminosus TaxID=2038154 RepID=A0A8K0DB28_IGNLU|nr:hypothetical protein ILUMI_05146 [Ignelater luminosus]
MGVFVEQSNTLVNQLKEECTKPFTDIIPYITRFTLNSICETAMGTQLDHVTDGQEKYRQAIYKMGDLLIYRVVRPWLYYDVIFYLTKSFREQRKVANTLHNFSLNVIRNRSNSQQNEEIRVDDEESLSSVKRRLAMLDLLISARNCGAQVDEEGIREEVDTFMFEGHDTTTMAICFTLMLLACHQDIQEKVVEELKEVLGDADEHPTYQKLQELKYLEMAIKESLRMYPSVPFISRVTSEDVQTHTGYTIPAGTYVNIPIYDLHHNPKYYPDPHKFDPYRFLPENAQKRHPFSYLPFSAGPRNCIGQKFAFLELKIVIAKILMKFTLLPYDKPDDITFITDMILRTENGIKIKIQSRV